MSNENRSTTITNSGSIFNSPEAKTTSDFEKLLLKTFKESEIDNKFCADTFFNNWFSSSDNKFFFLFKKNLRTTNLQYPELLSLIQSYHTVKIFIEGSTQTNIQNTQIRNLQFLSVQEFKTSIKALVIMFENNSDKYEQIVKLYHRLLYRALVVESFFGSCAVFIPPHLQIDLLSVCAYSGYIHSCGYNVFIEKIDQTTKDNFVKNLKSYVANIKSTKNDESPANSPKKNIFTVYCHEDFFNDHERGLEENKIYVEKYYMGKERLVSVLKSMRKTFQNDLEITDPGDFRETREELNKKEEIDRSRTIWLLIDYSIGVELKHPGEKRYYICYDQIYINENPFHIFDENKPAWYAHTTIPHTLMGAMINITKPFWQTTPVALTDPFVGTGTTLLEALKFGKSVNIKCRDIEKIAVLSAKDNLEIFTKTYENLADLSKKIRDISGLKQSGVPKNLSKSQEMAMQYDRAQIILSDIIPDPNDLNNQINIDSAIESLENYDLLTRMFIYLGLRTYLRHLAAFQRTPGDPAEEWKHAYSEEREKLIKSIEELSNLKTRVKDSKSNSISILNSKYSDGCCIDFGNFQVSTGEVISLGDARELEANSCDIIITDPPYGFNTDENNTELAILYEEVINAIINAIKPNGQLVICLPDESRIGRPLPLFTNKKLVTKQILASVERANREVIAPTYITQGEWREKFTPPYYWESERALKRAILHFRIR